ncbi:hypothetical protein [Variovorax sp. GB1P17]|uniref:hypothetical protein n=1 Tax=Variovorax sp. GB1P17 TaxID=3443740 RepID=UPI003F47BC95
MKLRRPSLEHLCCAAALYALAPAHAYTVGISSASRSLYLQVGVGNMTTGNVNTAGNNPTQNNVTVTVPVAALFTGAAQTMNTDSTVTASPIDGAAYCTPAGKVYIGSFFRTTGSSNNSATLTVSTPANLSNGSATIPFSTIAWTSPGAAPYNSEIPAGSFSSTLLTLVTVAKNTWSESCLLFTYSNPGIMPSGTFTGTATYTLTAP